MLVGCEQNTANPEEKESSLKLYWFIPDGMRAEPSLFNIYAWANEGELPNIKKIMNQGSYGFFVPVFPTHTPVNFATLLTGSHPKTHGVGDLVVANKAGFGWNEEVTKNLAIFDISLKSGTSYLSGK